MDKDFLQEQRRLAGIQEDSARVRVVGLTDDRTDPVNVNISMERRAEDFPERKPPEWSWELRTSHKQAGKAILRVDKQKGKAKTRDEALKRITSALDSMPEQKLEQRQVSEDVTPFTTKIEDISRMAMATTQGIRELQRNVFDLINKVKMGGARAGIEQGSARVAIEDLTKAHAEISKAQRLFYEDDGIDDLLESVKTQLEGF